MLAIGPFSFNIATFKYLKLECCISLYRKTIKTVQVEFAFNCLISIPNLGWEHLMLQWRMVPLDITVTVIILEPSPSIIDISCRWLLGAKILLLHKLDHDYLIGCKVLCVMAAVCILEGFILCRGTRGYSDLAWMDGSVPLSPWNHISF